MSKTLAAEIASRTLDVVNPANRPMALSATLRRHGFGPAPGGLPTEFVDRAAIVAWLLRSYGREAR